MGVIGCRGGCNWGVRGVEGKEGMRGVGGRKGVCKGV